LADWIDVTRPLQEGMVCWPGDPPFTIRSSTSGDCTISRIRTSVHAGTHIDAPVHFIPGGASIEQLELDALCGPALVIQVPEPRDVTADDLAGAPIRRGDRVLFKTANEPLWASGVFEPGFFALTRAAAEWLVERAVRLVGIDYLSVDRFDDADKPAHHILLAAGVVLVEGLDLSAVAPGRYELIALPLKITASDGSPARVLLRPMKQGPSSG